MPYTPWLTVSGPSLRDPAQRGYVGYEGPLLGPEPDDDLPDAGLHDLPDPEFRVPDPFTSLECCPS